MLYTCSGFYLLFFLMQPKKISGAVEFYFECSENIFWMQHNLKPYILRLWYSGFNL